MSGCQAPNKGAILAKAKPGVGWIASLPPLVFIPLLILGLLPTQYDCFQHLRIAWRFAANWFWPLLVGWALLVTLQFVLQRWTFYRVDWRTSFTRIRTAEGDDE